MADINKVPKDTPPEFVYLWVKAKNYLKTTPEAYRKRDFFKMPDAGWPPSMLDTIRRGMEQIESFQGHSRDNPFEKLGVEGFYALLETLHFELETQRVFMKCEPEFDGSLLDEMHMRHRVTGKRVVLYNRVQLSEN